MSGREKDLEARIKTAAAITCPALRHICEDSHPLEDFDPECAWCQIKRCLDLRRKKWRPEGEELR